MDGQVALAGFMRATSAQAARAIEAAFLEAHVFVTEAHQLGGLAVVLHWEMEGDHRAALAQALARAAVRLDGPSARKLEGPWEGPTTGSLHVTLEHGGPDEKVVVPSVPG